MSVSHETRHFDFLGYYAAGSVAAVVLLTACASTADQSNCNIEKPPRDAIAFGNHGYYFFTYPAVLNSKYTGCRTTWNELGQKVLVLKFKEGNPEQFLGAESTPGKLTKICNYSAGHLLGEVGDCPTYDEAKRTLSNEVTDDGLRIPPEKDPRQ